MQFIYNDNSPAAINHNNTCIKLCNDYISRPNQRTWILDFGLYSSAELFFSETFKFPKIPGFFNGGFIEFRYLGTKTAFEYNYEGWYPKRTPQCLLTNLRGSAQLGTFLSIVTGGKYLQIQNILIEESMFPLYLKWFDSGLLENVYLHRNTGPARIISCHGTKFDRFLVRENDGIGVIFEENQLEISNSTFESNKKQGAIFRNCPRSSFINTWFENCNNVSPTDKTLRFQAEFYDSSYCVFHGMTARERNNVYFDEVTRKTKYDFSHDYYFSNSTEPFFELTDYKLVDYAQQFKFIKVENNKTVVVPVDAYANETQVFNKSFEIQYKHDALEALNYKKGDSLLVSFDIELSPEDASFLTNHIKTETQIGPLFTFQFLGGNSTGGQCSVVEAPYVYSRGITSFNLLGKILIDKPAGTSPLRMFLNPHFLTRVGPKKEIKFTLKRLFLNYIPV